MNGSLHLRLQQEGVSRTCRSTDAEPLAVASGSAFLPFDRLNSDLIHDPLEPFIYFSSDRVESCIPAYN